MSHDSTQPTDAAEPGDQSRATPSVRPFGWVADDANDDWGRFAAAVDAARRLLARDGAVLIHCEAGVSRSSAVAAAALAVREDRQFVDALHEIQDYRVHAIPHPALHALGVQYVAASQ